MVSIQKGRCLSEGYMHRNYITKFKCKPCHKQHEYPSGAQTYCSS